MWNVKLEMLPKIMLHDSYSKFNAVNNIQYPENKIYLDYFKYFCILIQFCVKLS